MLIECFPFYGWDMCLRVCFAATRVRTDLSRRRALELVVDSREAALGHRFRWQPANHVRLESPFGARREATQAGGGSQPEERHSLAAEVHMIVRRQKTTRFGGFSNKYYRTQHILRSGDSIRVLDQTPSIVGTQLSIGCLWQCA
jgi:hypothetical protein